MQGVRRVVVGIPMRHMRATVLVVDDEQLIRWSLASRLGDDGYRVLEAATAAEALDRFREGVDLVLGLNRDQIRYRIETFKLERTPSP